MKAVFSKIRGFFGDDWGWKCGGCGKHQDFCSCKKKE